MDKKEIEKLWNKFVKETQYVDLDGKGKIPLKKVCIDFASFVVDEVNYPEKADGGCMGD